MGLPTMAWENVHNSAIEFAVWSTVVINSWILITGITFVAQRLLRPLLRNPITTEVALKRGAQIATIIAGIIGFVASVLGILEYLGIKL